MSEEYPKFMCRAGGTEECRGRMIESGCAADEAQEQAMLEDGWVYAPEEIDAPTEPEITARGKKAKGADPAQQGNA